MFRCFSLIVALCFAVSVARAQETPKVVNEIIINGTMRIEPETVLTYLMIRQGDIATPDRLDRGLKSLFSTGLFADVKLSEKNGVLTVDLVENPIVNKIAFEGNKKIKTDQLTGELSLRPRTVFTRAKARSDTQRIVELYRRVGRYSAVVEPKIIERPQNRLDVVFEITEGEPTYIRKIDFIGNNAFDTDVLEEAMLSKEARWYRWFTSTDTYDPDRFAYDQELLRRFYFNHGYIDFEVVSSSAELSPNRKDFYLTLMLSEGKKYKVGKIDITSSLKGFNPETVRTVPTFKTGKTFNQSKVDDSVLALTNAVGAQGFPFVDVDYKLNKHDDATVDVVFDVKEGQHLFIDRIDIRGNNRTQDRVIRREFRFRKAMLTVPPKSAALVSGLKT